MSKTEMKAERPPAKKKVGRPRSEDSPETRAKLERFAGGKATGLTDVEAVRRAGYRQTRAAAKVTAKRLKARADVQRMISERREELRAHARVEECEIVGTVARQMRGFDLLEVFPDDPLVQRLAAVGATSTAVIRRLTFDRQTGRVVGIEWYDAQQAAKLLGQWRGLDREPAEGWQAAELRELKNRVWARDRLLDLMEKDNLTRKEAMEHLREHAPTLAKWLT